jgi:hypothetical protein
MLLRLLLGIYPPTPDLLEVERSRCAGKLRYDHRTIIRGRRA